MPHTKCYIQNCTYIRLLPGVHHIDSTKGHSITIENVHSLILTGDKEGIFIVYPEDFHFMFTLVENMVISNLTFSFCELSFSNYKRNLTIIRVNITDRRLLLLIVLYIFNCKVIDNNYAMICNDFKLKSPIKTTRKCILCLLLVFRDQCWLKKSIWCLHVMHSARNAATNGQRWMYQYIAKVYSASFKSTSIHSSSSCTSQLFPMMTFSLSFLALYKISFTSFTYLNSTSPIIFHMTIKA